MSSAVVAPELLLLVLTRDPSGMPTHLRLLGAENRPAVPRARIGPDRDLESAAQSAGSRLLETDTDVGALIRDALVFPIAGSPASTVVLLDDPDPVAPAFRVAIIDLPLVGTDRAHAMRPDDLRAISAALGADGHHRGESNDALGRRLQPAYEAVAQRHVAHTSLMWQVPGLSLTAQAFLLTLALGAGTAPVPRLAAAVVALVLSIVSVQLLRRHSHHELVDRRILERLELLAGWPVGHARPPVSGSAFVDYPSRRLWAIALSMFGLAAVAVILAVWLDAADLTHIFD